MAQLSSSIVSGYNSIVGVFSTASAYVPPGVKDGLTHLFKNLGSGPQKNFWTKPVTFLGDTLKFINNINLNQHPTIAKIATFTARAYTARAFVSAPEVLSNLPGALEALSTPVPVGKSEAIRSYVSVKDNSQSNTPILEIKEKTEAPQISGVEVVAKRVFSVALWFISLGDAINEVKSVVEFTSGPSAFPPLVSRVVPWIQTGAGMWMGAWGLYEELKFAAETWRKEDNKVYLAEKNHSLAKIAMSVSYLTYSILSGLGLYLGTRVPARFGTAKFVVSASTIIIPMVAQWMKENVDALHKKIKDSELETLKAAEANKPKQD